MVPQALQCGKCHAALPQDFPKSGEFASCPACQTQVMVDIFPAWTRPKATAPLPQRILSEEDAGCFYHPEQKAILPCDECGRFLCTLCDCEIQGRHLCPNCLDTAQKKSLIRNLETRRLLYDKIALALAVYPLLIFYATIFTAPAALYVAIRHWKSPGGIIPRTKIRYVAAIILALLQIAGWAILFIVLIMELTKR